MRRFLSGYAFFSFLNISYRCLTLFFLLIREYFCYDWIKIFSIFSMNSFYDHDCSFVLFIGLHIPACSIDTSLWIQFLSLSSCSNYSSVPNIVSSPVDKVFHGTINFSVPLFQFRIVLVCLFLWWISFLPLIYSFYYLTIRLYFLGIISGHSIFFDVMRHTYNHFFESF